MVNAAERRSCGKMGKSDGAEKAPAVGVRMAAQILIR